MNRSLFVASWFLLVFMVVLLSVVYTLHARAAQQERGHASTAFAQICRQYEQQLNIRTRELRSALAASEKREIETLAILSKLGSKEPPLVSARKDEDPSEDVVSPGIEGREEVLTQLPDILEGVDPEGFLTTAMDLKAVVEDRRFNPGARQLNRVERLQLLAEVKRARAALDVLDTDIHLSVAGGVETLRERGDFVEYGKGDNYQVLPGVLSAGEEMENGGVRIFYLQPEEFKDLYTKKSDRSKLVDHSVRRILAQVQGPVPRNE